MSAKTDAQLTTDANVIKNETATGANSATRVGNMFIDAIDSKINKQDIDPYSSSIVNYTTISGGGSPQTAGTIVTTLNKRASYEIILVSKRLTGGVAVNENTWSRKIVHVANNSGVLTTTQDTIYDRTDGSGSVVFSVLTSGANLLLSLSNVGSGTTHSCIFYIRKIEI